MNDEELFIKILKLVQKLEKEEKDNILELAKEKEFNKIQEIIRKEEDASLNSFHQEENKIKGVSS